MPVSYNEWLSYVLRAEGVDKPALVHASGLSSERVEELTRKGGSAPTTAEVDQIAAALNIPRANMERSLRAMQVYDNLKQFKEDCAGACCPWNAPID